MGTWERSTCIDADAFTSSSTPALGSSIHCRGSALPQTTGSRGSGLLLMPFMLSRSWSGPCVAMVRATNLQSSPKILGLFSLWFAPCALTWAKMLLG